MMILTLGRKLALGFGTIILLVAAMSGMVYVKSRAIRENASRISNVDAPTAFADSALTGTLILTQKRAADAMLAGLDTSSEMEKTKKAFAESWQSTGKNIGALEKLSSEWATQEDRDRLAQLKEEIPKLRRYQDDGVSLAQSREKDAVIRGSRVFNEGATPQSQKIRKVLTEMSDNQMKLLMTDQSRLVADIRSLDFIVFLSGFVVLVIGVSVATIIGRQISHASRTARDCATAIAAGDLTGDQVPVVSHDELGELAAAINKMQASLRQVIHSISENAQNVANASEEFSSVSQQITANSEETSAQANAVSVATEEVNRNLQTVATATEEMSASISEIAKNATEAAKVAAEAMKTATETNAIVGKLGESSAEIGQVIKTITSIAQKTDLLALNATVEAARAGEVGAGFAVVANEVKELAKQTAAATEDISRKIEAIQGDTKGAVQAISAISGIITRVNEISGTIAAAVEEQSATTNEMSRNLTEAAKGATQVTENIGGVAQAAQNTSHGATDSLKAAQQLAKMSTQLRSLVDQFKLHEDHAGAARPPRGPARAFGQSEDQPTAREEVFNR